MDSQLLTEFLTLWRGKLSKTGVHIYVLLCAHLSVYGITGLVLIYILIPNFFFKWQVQNLCSLGEISEKPSWKGEIMILTTFYKTISNFSIVFLQYCFTINDSKRGVKICWRKFERREYLWFIIFHHRLWMIWPLKSYQIWFLGWVYMFCIFLHIKLVLA